MKDKVCLISDFTQRGDGFSLKGRAFATARGFANKKADIP